MLDICIVTYNSAKLDTDRLVSEIEMHTPELHAVHVFSNDAEAVNLAMAKNDLAKRGARNYLIFLSPDVHLEPGWAGNLVKELEAAPVASCIVPRGIIQPNLSSEKDDPLSFVAVLMRRKTWEKLKGFDERFRFYGADADFRKRIGVVERGDVIQSKAVAMRHSKGLPLYKAASGAGTGLFYFVNEVNHRDAIRNRISDGTIKMWHDLDDEERESFRKNPAYLVRGPVIS